MNTERIRTIIKDCLWGESFSVDEEPPAGCEVVDTVFFKVGFDKAKAESHAEELSRIVMESEHAEMWLAGPSYIHVGGWVGDQRDALILIALGQVAGLWQCTTPRDGGLTDDEQVRELAGAGFVYATEFKPKT